MEDEKEPEYRECELGYYSKVYNAYCELRVWLEEHRGIFPATWDKPHPIFQKIQDATTEVRDFINELKIID